MRYLSIAILAAAAAHSGSAYAAAPPCSGNACNDVVFSFQNGCYVIKNHGTRRVKITMGPFSFTLQREESHTLIGLDGRCATAYVGSNSANYE